MTRPHERTNQNNSFRLISGKESMAVREGDKEAVNFNYPKVRQCFSSYIRNLVNEQLL